MSYRALVAIRLWDEETESFSHTRHYAFYLDNEMTVGEKLSEEFLNERSYEAAVKLADHRVMIGGLRALDLKSSYEREVYIQSSGVDQEWEVYFMPKDDYTRGVIEGRDARGNDIFMRAREFAH